MTIRRSIVVGAVLATVVALAGCSSANSNSTSGGSTSGTPGAEGAASNAPVVSSTQLTGTRLTAAMLTSSDIPVAGFSTPSNSGGDSGGSLTKAKAKFNPGTMSCADLQNDLGEAGFGETAMSTRALTSASRETVSQTVYQFADAAVANVFYTAVKASTESCSTFTSDSQGFDMKFSVTITEAKPGVGQQDFASTQVGTLNGSAAAIAITTALDGPDVLLVSAAKLGAATVPTDVDSGSLLAKLIGKVAAAG